MNSSTVAGTNGWYRTSWWNVVASPPYVHLLVSKLLGRVSLVSALQVAVVPLVQPPALLDRYPELIKLFKDVLQRFDCPLQYRCVRLVKLEAFCPQ